MSEVNNVTVKARIYPNDETKVFIEKLFGCTRFCYNEIIARFKRREIKGKNPFSYFSLAKYIGHEIKPEHPFLHTDCDISTRRGAAQDASVAIGNFFDRRKKGQKCNLSFKKKNNPKQCAYTWIYLSENGKYIRFRNSKTYTRIKGMRDLGEMVTCRVIREYDKYYICITYKVERKTPYKQSDIKANPENYSCIGVDAGLEHYLTTSDGEQIDNPRYYRQLEKKKARLQRKLSKKQGYRKGEKKSNNYKRLQSQIRKIDNKIANQRKDFLHKVSRDLVDNYQFIATERLNIPGMVKNKRLSKSVYDAAWGTFFHMLGYKTEWENKVFLQVDQFYPSSQLCHKCGYQNKDVKNLSVREWDCPSCNTHHDRDINAAINVLNEGLRIVGQSMSESTLPENA